MREWLLDYLRCPVTREYLRPEQVEWNGETIESGMLVGVRSAHAYPIIEGIPRMLPGVRTKEDLRRVYADSFGYQWNELQWEREIDESEYFSVSDQTPELLRGKIVLDAGCGGGRVSRVMARHCKRLVGLDLTVAVDRAYRHTDASPHCQFVQGDILQPPFARDAFDYVWSHGVLHHTSDTRTGFDALTELVKQGGLFHAIVFLEAWAPLRVSDAALRAAIRKLPYAAGVRVCRWMGILRRLPFASFWKRFVWFSTQPTAELRTYCNFDWYMPRHHHEHTVEEVMSWYRDAGFSGLRYINGWPYAPEKEKYAAPTFGRRARLGQLLGVVGQRNVDAGIKTMHRDDVEDTTTRPTKASEPVCPV